MKYIIKLVLLSFLFICGKAYANGLSDNLLDPSKCWSVLEDKDQPPIVKYKKSTWYRIGEDSILNNISYKKILKSQDEDQNTWKTDCLMREEESKIFMKEQWMDSEVLLYDFGLKEGEYTEYSDGARTLRTYIDEIKDTLINGTIRKIFLTSVTEPNYNWGAVSETWIEGLGSLLGLKRESSRFSTGSYSDWTLLCVSEEDEEVYHSLDFEKCYYHIIDYDYSSIEEKEVHSFKVYLGPEKGMFVISSDHSFQNLPVKIYNITGECVWSSSFNSGDMLIDLRSRNRGTYILNIGNGLKTHKIIVN